jgi:hypothetical protein
MTINANASAGGSARGVKSDASNAHNYTNSSPGVQSADPYELVLSHASGVKRLGPDKAVFKAPTREDRTASVSICRGADGTVLLHDFGGDSAADILAGLGLSLASLYPQRDRRDMTPAERAEMRAHSRMAGWTAILGTIGLESKIVVIAGRQIKAGKPLSDEDERRLDEALINIDAGREVLTDGR